MTKIFKRPKKQAKRSALGGLCWTPPRRYKMCFENINKIGNIAVLEPSLGEPYFTVAAGIIPYRDADRFQATSNNHFVNLPTSILGTINSKSKCSSPATSVDNRAWSKIGK